MQGGPDSDPSTLTREAIVALALEAAQKQGAR
jgi:hypothetical protein